MILNCLGKACPIPVVETKAALEKMAVGEDLCVQVDGPVQVANVSRFLSNHGCEVKSQQVADGSYEIKTVKVENSGETEAARATVVLSGTEMGQGDEKLGALLMKSFVFALTQTVADIQTIVCYNGGVKLCVEGSPVLEDLQKLAEAGVEIQVCGTCLDYYQLKEKLAVGQISNMYSIVEAQLNGSKILRP